VCAKHSVLVLLQSTAFLLEIQDSNTEMMSQASRILLAGNDWLRKCIQGPGSSCWEELRMMKNSTYMRVNLVLLAYVCFGQCQKPPEILTNGRKGKLGSTAFTLQKHLNI
jgi:hypothetical protein